MPLTNDIIVSMEGRTPYVIVEDIGKGSLSTVHKGYREVISDTLRNVSSRSQHCVQGSHQEVAIKIIRRDALTAKLSNNLQREIKCLKLLHKHIVQLIDVIDTEQEITLIMEYCGGGNLTNYIARRGRVEGLEYIPSPGSAPIYYPHPHTGGLDETVVRSFLRQLARALKFLRQKDLVNRHIKPQVANVFIVLANPISKTGVPILKIADFGFARTLPDGMMAETLCGTPPYMAPEILRHEKYSAKVDLWSVGVVLFEMCVGKPPFHAHNHIELLGEMEQSNGLKFPDESPNPENSGGGSKESPVPRDVKELIRVLLKRNPVDRVGFEGFFASEAVKNSTFPNPRKRTSRASNGNLLQTDQRSVHDGAPPAGNEILGSDRTIEKLDRGADMASRAPSPTKLLSEPEEDDLLYREYVLIDP
ncbi:hypothetical protein DXG01_009702 [Tephrocybe rancida]|nr:hypothetical protein DXG01_009702 [Tephrocybe rancida]